MSPPLVLIERLAKRALRSLAAVLRAVFLLASGAATPGLGGANPVRVAPDWHSLALESDGTVVAWGERCSPA